MRTIINRDISWLEFNLRVLQEAADASVPLYERIKFLSIFSSNLDEFFRVRYPYITTLSKLNKKIRKQAGSEAQEDITGEIQQEINRQLDLYGEILQREILPELQKNRIVFYYSTSVRPEHLAEIRELFLSKILSFIQPIYLDPQKNHRFHPENSKLYLFVSIKGKEPGTLQHGIVNIPSDKLQRFYVLSPIDGYEYVVFIDDIIRLNMSFLFPGSEIQGIYSIKFNRDSEIFLDNELSGDILLRIEKEVKKRDLGAPSRFLYEANMPRNVQFLIAGLFNLNFDEMFAGGHYHQLSDLASFPKFNRNLLYPARKQLLLPELQDTADIFNLLHTKDILLHLPYQSYNPVLSFFNQAAVDTDVTEIYITLYRVASESHIINALISAARNGKKVTAFVELKARFDEYNNIRWSKEMKKAGVNIIYSLPSIKVHSKIAVVKKNSQQQALSYALLSTGNFNEITAQFYTDHVLMTTNPGIVQEMLLLFKLLQREHSERTRARHSFEKLLVSRFNMKEQFEKLIDGEMQKIKTGKKGLIRIKLNNLEEPNLINALYQAAEQGVEVQLIVRSICCMQPGAGSNITIKRLVDRYLEHSRLFLFGDDVHAEVIMGSADWMNRNIHHRIEVCVPILSPDCKKELLDYFNMQWNDNAKTTLIGAKDPNRTNGHTVAYAAQQVIYDYLQIK
ncbi:polyphosphate kinase 1 [Sediminibacterium soli]|uniref:polyphosphate kinase 1 n=1 Tax=Sediminibacterium soli TaxID=2698829 RepID=UPI00137A2FF2|nr:polyphosphate kinase 1 [Sediminibacterium soli]NCI45895.1 polyphosphate kinase 1 [Sediminibacterium soli]